VASRHFRNKESEYLKDKINELESNRTRTSETSTGAQLNLRRVINLELTE
jgi:hypothetical protein